MIKKSPIPKKEMNRLGDRFWRRIRFNKKFREGVKEDFLHLQKSALKMIDSFPVAASIKTGKDKVLAETMLDVSDLYLKEIKKVEKNEKFYNQRGTFILFRKGKTYIFNDKTLRDKKVREGNIIFDDGLPKRAYKKGLLVKKVMDLGGFTKIDSGKYHFKQKGYDFGSYSFWGKTERYFLSFDKTKVLSKRPMKFEMRFKRIV